VNKIRAAFNEERSKFEKEWKNIEKLTAKKQK
jgi:hypothetical protein